MLLYGMFMTDDRKACQVALGLRVKVTGTLGILVVAVEQRKIALVDGNQLLAKMIERRYRSPVGDLRSLFS